MKITDRQQDIIYFLRDSGHLSLEEISNNLNLSIEDLSIDLGILSSLDIIGRREGLGYFYKGNQSFAKLGDMLKVFPVETIMSLPVIIEDTLSIYDAIVMLFLENVGAIYVTRNNILAGVVSRKDLLRVTLGKTDLHNTPVNLIMTRMPNIKYVTKDSSIIECAKLIVDSQVDGVPVVEILDNEEQMVKVIGRVTKTNITNLFVSLAGEYNYEGLLWKY